MRLVKIYFWCPSRQCFSIFHIVTVHYISYNISPRISPASGLFEAAPELGVLLQSVKIPTLGLSGLVEFPLFHWDEGGCRAGIEPGATIQQPDALTT